MDAKYKGLRVEFHILQSFPVTCLNRDDVGAPKTAIVGGVVRARVSSQCWKRQVRLAMRDFDIKLGVRTKFVANKISEHISDEDATAEQKEASSEAIAKLLTKDTLYFFSETEAKALAGFAVERKFEIDEKKDLKAIVAIQKSALKSGFKELDGLDIALFGRMVAQAVELNVEAATSFSHAISTHKVANEIDYFTAVDDERDTLGSNAGSSHIGSLEFNSATYYRYVSVNIGQLVESLGGDEQLDKALEAFIKALYVGVPIARQSTQAGSNLWDYAKVYVRRGQGLQASFDAPVKSRGEGFLKPSITALDDFLLKKEKMSGSLFGSIADYTWGLDENYSIDNLTSDVVKAVRT
ncbi:MAG: type I-E CRISPR-associated protein Cas7/Cse4/CasC [Sphaerochaeta sp.]